MINKMEGSSGGMPIPAESTDNQTIKSISEPAGALVEGSDDADSGTDAEKFVREKSLLLLSALFYLYGAEEWGADPDWTKVTVTLQELNIPIYGEDFTPESCEKLYKDLFEKGAQLGICQVKLILRPPKRLTDASKRCWMIAQLSTDIVRTSQVMEKRLQRGFRAQMRVLEMITKGEVVTSEADSLRKAFDMTAVELPEDHDPIYSDQFEDPEAQIAALHLWQLELMEGIVGMKDVLQLVHYCNSAVEYALKNYESMMKLPSPSQITTPALPELVDKKPEIMNHGETENAVGNKTPVKHADQMNAPAGNVSPLNEVKKEVVIPKKSDEKPATDSENRPMDNTIKYIALDPSAKPSTRSNSGDVAPIQPLFISPAKNVGVKSFPGTPCNSFLPINNLVDCGEPSPSSTASTIVSSSTSATTLVDANGDVGLDDEMLLTPTSTKSDIASQEDKGDVPNPPSSEKEIQSEQMPPEKPTEPKKSEVKPDFETTMGKVVAEVYSELSSSLEGCIAPRELDRIQARALKGRKGPRKSVGADIKVSKRTSGRIISPEPDEDKAPKRTRGRNASSSDTVTKLRRRKTATPTATASTVDKDSSKLSSGNTKSGTVRADENADDSFETPRTTPELPTNRSDLETNQDARPIKPMKTYSVKPPSPLSQVDPKIFDDYNDDEDDPELAMIDNNLNKTKGEKGSSTKSNSKRGRTVSSENTSEINEEHAHAKRATRRAGPTDDADETPDSIGQSNDDKSKRLTRSSLKIHDASNDEGTEPSSRTGSEKAASESSFGGGKEKKSRQSKSMTRVKKLFDEKHRIFGDDDLDEKTPDRVTRARAKTSTSFTEKRPKLSSVEPEGGTDSDATPTRATRSRASTNTSSAVAEPAAVAPQPTLSDNEDSKLFRKNALAFVEKLAASELGSSIQKFSEDSNKICKHPTSCNEIRQRIETGKIKSLASLRMDLSSLGLNLVFAKHNLPQAPDAAIEFYKMLNELRDLSEPKHPRSSSSHKMDTSDVESLESHDESRSDVTPKNTPSSGGRGPRKRRRSASETSEEVFLQDKQRRVTRTSVSSTSYTPVSSRKPKHPISPDIVSANRVRH